MTFIVRKYGDYFAITWFVRNHQWKNDQSWSEYSLIVNTNEMALITITYRFNVNKNQTDEFNHFEYSYNNDFNAY